MEYNLFFFFFSRDMGAEVFPVNPIPQQNDNSREGCFRCLASSASLLLPPINLSVCLALSVHARKDKSVLSLPSTQGLCKVGMPLSSIVQCNGVPLTERAAHSKDPICSKCNPHKEASCYSHITSSERNSAVERSITVTGSKTLFPTSFLFIFFYRIDWIRDVYAVFKGRYRRVCILAIQTCIKRRGVRNE